jgi:hypothetical protein
MRASRALRSGVFPVLSPYTRGANRVLRRAPFRRVFVLVLVEEMEVGAGALLGRMPAAPDRRCRVSRKAGVRRARRAGQSSLCLSGSATARCQAESWYRIIAIVAGSATAIPEMTAAASE